MQYVYFESLTGEGQVISWVSIELTPYFILGVVPESSGCSRWGRVGQRVEFYAPSIPRWTLFIFWNFHRPRRERPAQRRDGSGERVGTLFCFAHWTSSQNSIWPGVAESARMTLVLTENRTGPLSVKLPRKYRNLSV